MQMNKSNYLNHKLLNPAHHNPALNRALKEKWVLSRLKAMDSSNPSFYWQGLEMQRDSGGLWGSAGVLLGRESWSKYGNIVGFIRESEAAGWLQEDTWSSPLTDGSSSSLSSWPVVSVWVTVLINYAYKGLRKPRSCSECGPQNVSHSWITHISTCLAINFHLRKTTANIVLWQKRERRERKCTFIFFIQRHSIAYLTHELEQRLTSL